MTTNLWERQEYESRQAFAAFHDYYLALPRRERSLDQAYRNYLRDRRGTVSDSKRAPGSWRAWAYALEPRTSEKYIGRPTWAERSAAWDAHVDEATRERWLERAEELRDREWRLAHRLETRLEELLNRPVDDARFTTADFAKLALATSELLRRAAGVATQKSETEMTGSLTTGPASPLASLSDEELRAEIERMERRFGPAVSSASSGTGPAGTGSGEGPPGEGPGGGPADA